MYLTRMALNPARRGTRFLLASPQRVHAAVMSAFPPGSDEEGRVLWRVDSAVNRHTLYISSPGRPDLTHVVEQAGWPSLPDAWSCVSMTPRLDSLAAGQTWAFRLTANPVHSVRGPDGGRGKRLGHVTVDQQDAWLRTRAPKWGFDVVDAVVVGRRTESFARRADGERGTVTLSTATFEGVLQVADAAAFRQAITAGMGRAKGYGCGLLTIAPVRRAE